MKIKSKGRRTDLFFAKEAGQVLTREDYIVIKTPDNPTYHWGNYIIFKNSPSLGNLSTWKRIFDDEFDYYEGPHHYTFTWEEKGIKEDGISEFTEDGFEYDTGIVLTGLELKEPRNINKDIVVKEIVGDRAWQEVLDLQILCLDQKFVNSDLSNFKKSLFKQYKKLSDAGHGHWYGAYLKNELIGDLGLYNCEGLGRYQLVETSPKHRRNGVCATLVYQAAIIFINNQTITNLVIEADEGSSASRIYESVGLTSTEINHSLSWWKK